MKILLAPSEAKSTLNTHSSLSFSFDVNQKEIIEKFNSFLKINKDFKNFCKDQTPIEKRETTFAINRYTGVAFKHLDYNSLDKESKEFLNNNLIIFSNLFGILKPIDLIPYYTLKQGKTPGFDIYKEYSKYITPLLDEINKKEIFIDLRAKFYEKIYKPKNAITFKFIKNNKVVSHFAKAYRGKLTAIISKHKPKTIEDVLKISFPDIEIVEIIEKKGIKEIVCNVN